MFIVSLIPLPDCSRKELHALAGIISRLCGKEILLSALIGGLETALKRGVTQAVFQWMSAPGDHRHQCRRETENGIYPSTHTHTYTHDAVSEAPSTVFALSTIANDDTDLFAHFDHHTVLCNGGFLAFSFVLFFLVKNVRDVNELFKNYLCVCNQVLRLRLLFFLFLQIEI